MAAPFHHARIHDDGAGAFSIIMAVQEPRAPDDATRFMSLTMNAGTTLEEASELARAINARLARTSIIQL